MLDNGFILSFWHVITIKIYNNYEMLLTQDLLKKILLCNGTFSDFNIIFKKE